MTLITPAEFAATDAKIAKINERAAKKGFTGRVTLTAERVEVARDIIPGLTVTEVMYDVTLGGEAPSYNGWTLAAVLDFDPEAGLIVNTAPGVDKVNREGLEAGYCGHCNTIRNRRKAYLVRNVATGEQVQVGSTCIKDFLGWTGLISFLSQDDIEREVEIGGGMGYSDPRFTVDSVLSIAWACIKVGGWKPAGNYGSTTREDVASVLMPRSKMSDTERAFVAQIGEFAATENITARAAEVREFILSDAFGGDSEYVLNLKALMGADNVGPRHLGLLVSAPQAHARSVERTLVAEKTPASKHFGQVGDKVEFTGTITSIRYIEGQYGTTVLYVIRNLTTGVEVKWFASKDALGDDKGVEVTVKGTVKGHDTYQGNESTVLTRCKAI
jgi:hypothetical protein